MAAIVRKHNIIELAGTLSDEEATNLREHIEQLRVRSRKRLDDLAELL